MKKILLPAAALGMVLAAAPGRAEQPMGFYIRGDLGLALVRPMEFRDIDPATGIFGADIIPTQGRTSSFLFDGGVGWRFTPAFRIDATLGYLPHIHFDGTQSDAAHFTGNITSFVGLANGYVDFCGLFPASMPRWINPFLVGSVGFAVNHLGSANDAFFAPSPEEPVTGATHTDLAWGVGAGFGLPVNERLSFDVTYKYTDYGEVRTGTSASFLGMTFTGTAAKANLRANTLTFGARYGF